MKTLVSDNNGTTMFRTINKLRITTKPVSKKTTANIHIHIHYIYIRVKHKRTQATSALCRNCGSSVGADVLEVALNCLLFSCRHLKIACSFFGRVVLNHVEYIKQKQKWKWKAKTNLKAWNLVFLLKVYFLQYNENGLI